MSTFKGQDFAVDPKRALHIALLVGGAYFMENLDGTIIATAGPRMARSLGVQAVQIEIAITVYLISVATFIPVSGRLAERWGPRTVFAVAIALFTGASVLCALAPNLETLTATRALQGVGAAMTVPVGRLVVLRNTHRSDLLRVIAVLTWPGITAPLVAPLLGGLVVSHTSWRWIFVINAPLGVLGFVLALRLIPRDTERKRPSMDWVGFLLLGGGLGFFMLGIDRMGGGTATGVGTIGLTIGIVTLLLGYVHLRRARHPLLDLSTMRFATFRITNLGGSLFRTVISAIPFLLPVMFQQRLGWSPPKSGLLVTALFVGNVAMKPFVTVVLGRLGFRRSLVLANGVTALSVVACAVISNALPLLVAVAILLISGAARSLGFTAYNTVRFADIEPEQMNDANTLSASVEQVSLALGVAVGALVLRIGFLTAGHAGSEDYRPYLVAFLLLGLLSVVTVVESARVPRDAGTSIRLGVRAREVSET